MKENIAEFQQRKNRDKKKEEVKVESKVEEAKADPLQNFWQGAVFFAILFFFVFVEQMVSSAVAGGGEEKKWLRGAVKWIILTTEN